MLARHQLWWQGPHWLSHSSQEWPNISVQPASQIDLEQQPGLLLLTKIAPQPQIWDLINKYSNLTRLYRITAICQRFIAVLKKVPQSSLSTSLTPEDLESSRWHWVRVKQQAYFTQELKSLARGALLPSNHVLSSLTAFVDHHGILRVGGRLKHSNLDPEEKHPAFLPRDSPLTKLLIQDAHDRTLHGGTQLTLAYLRRSYWIIGGRTPVRSFILRCIRCARQRGLRAPQLMSQLPLARLTPAQPLFVTDVDYATLKTWRGRGSKTHNGWMAIFVCIATSAVHLEVVSDYSTQCFIAAYRRFVSRKGICTHLYSDCGTTFIGADAELKKLFISGSRENKALSHLLANDGTHWSFNPPAAPHMGGKWDAAVKSVKFHLRRTIGDTLMTLEEFTTLLAQIEATLNSRPLCPLKEDPEDFSVLTPGHFLIGEALKTIPEPSLTEVPLNHLNRWQLIQQKLQQFWARWSQECLQRYQFISKWKHPSTQIKKGSMVLLTDERFPPSKWPLARVISLHPGSDGLTRLATIKTATTTLVRPVVKLVVLPITEEPLVSQSEVATP